MKRYFVLLYGRGENWKGNENWDKQDLMAHGKYMATLQAQGVLLRGGPFDDGSGGMSVIAVETEEDAKNIIENDPVIQNKVFSVRLIPWLIAFETQPSP